MDLTRRTTKQSGIPLISSILATLGCKALHGRATHASPAIANANQPIICLAGVDLSAERSEDGAGGRYTALLRGAARQIHCSNHSGVVTGADTFVRPTPTTIARNPGHFERLSFGYFSLARQRKVTAAPRRGDANRPKALQAIHEKH
ncbi:hypothetical protein [Burkholderia ubonensis]|uniref:hypothetical protein n=1 Tax=Burkholderia ubonensis TaxID=101571 RepID=UPI0015A63B75|nr:hypothetical protein [Burkholderia ubonensis]